MAETYQKKIFQDKIKVAEIAIDQELNLINQYTGIINAIKFNNYPVERINELEPYHCSWAHASQLFDFLKGDYLDLLKDKKQDRLIELVGLYQLGKECTLENLYEVKELILEIMSKTGFHNVTRDFDEDDEGL